MASLSRGDAFDLVLGPDESPVECERGGVFVDTQSTRSAGDPPLHVLTVSLEGRSGQKRTRGQEQGPAGARVPGELRWFGGPPPNTGRSEHLTPWTVSYLRVDSLCHSVSNAENSASGEK